MIARKDTTTHQDRERFTLQHPALRPLVPICRDHLGGFVLILHPLFPLGPWLIRKSPWFTVSIVPVLLLSRDTRREQQYSILYLVVLCIPCPSILHAIWSTHPSLDPSIHPSLDLVHPSIHLSCRPFSSSPIPFFLVHYARQWCQLTDDMLLEGGSC